MKSKPSTKKQWAHALIALGDTLFKHAPRPNEQMTLLCVMLAHLAVRENVTLPKLVLRLMADMEHITNLGLPR